MINEDKIREVWASNPERGFKLLIDFFQQPIYWHIRRLVVSHEDAEDILQEVFIRVFRHLPQFREESSLGTWIYRIATNECLRFLNMRKEQAVSAEEVQEELMNKLMEAGIERRALGVISLALRAVFHIAQRDYFFIKLDISVFDSTVRYRMYNGVFDNHKIAPFS